jgi:MFS family permease
MKPYLIRICLLAAAGGFLFGFDTSVISGVIEYISAPQVYNLSEISKGWTVSCIIIGCMIGCVLAGPLSTRCGRKGALIFTAFVFFTSSLGCAFASCLFLSICGRRKAKRWNKSKGILAGNGWRRPRPFSRFLLNPF